MTSYFTFGQQHEHSFEDEVLERQNMSIPFTQFLMPDGRRKAVTIDSTPEIETKAKELIAAGYCFEIEMLMTGCIAMECCTPDGEEPLAFEICSNGPPVVDAVNKLVRDAHNNMRLAIAE
jgi:hypothetical protein